MKLFPAIDLRDGKVVRLLKGNFGDETIYGEDPVEVARTFESEGAHWIHVVDLDAAKTGVPTNRPLVGAIAEAVSVPVQVGGGVRDRSSASALFDLGVRRVVLGTAAVEDPGLVEWLAERYPGRIAVGLDARGGRVAVRGWVEGGDTKIVDVVRRFDDHAIAAFVITDIERDGTLGGPDLRGLSEVVEITDVDVIASGGVGSLDDLRAIASARPGGTKRIAGAIVGKALYENRFTVASAVAVCDSGSEKS